MPIVSKRKPSSEANREWSLAIFERFAKGRKLGPESVTRVFEEIEKHYKPSTVSLIFRICRSEYEWWPREIRYSYSQSEVTRDVMTADEVRTMIRGASTLRYSEMIAHLFLSTIYGLRREELSRSRPEHLDRRAGTILVLTAKGGVERRHLVPDVGMTILEAGLVKTSTRMLNDEFKILEKASGIDHIAGRSWHSIRRSLATRLFELSIDSMQVKKFMRWKEGSMYDHYISVDYSTADREILGKHPFLGHWEDVCAGKV